MGIRIAGYEITCDYRALQCPATGPTADQESEARDAARADGWDVGPRKRIADQAGLIVNVAPGGEREQLRAVDPGGTFAWHMDFCPQHAGTCCCPLTWGCRAKADGPDGLCAECRAERHGASHESEG